MSLYSLFHIHCTFQREGSKQAFGGSSVIQSTLSVEKVREERLYRFTVCSQYVHRIARERTLSALLLNWWQWCPCSSRTSKDEVAVYIQQPTLWKCTLHSVCIPNDSCPLRINNNSTLYLFYTFLFFDQVNGAFPRATEGLRQVRGGSLI